MKRATSDPRLEAPPDEGALGNDDLQIHREYLKTWTKFATLGNKKRPKIERLTARKKSEWLRDAETNGFVRLYTPAGDRSLAYPLSVETTAAEICTVFGFQNLYLQIGNLHISCLQDDARPLYIQNELLLSLGYLSLAECLELGDAAHLRFVFAFFMGRPEGAGEGAAPSDLLVANCFVRKGRLLQRWVRRRCILFNGTVRIEAEREADEMLLLSNFRVEVAECSRGKYLRLTDGAQQLCIGFDNAADLSQWTSRALQCQMVPHCDLSDRHLLFLPDQLFSVGSQRLITSLNLRRNSLMSKPPAAKAPLNPIIGWLDDLTRFQSVRVLNLADNALRVFPAAVTEMPSVQELVLCGNRIPLVPPSIRLMTNLTVLNLSNNWLTTVPGSLAECTLLASLDLSFNRLEEVPEALFHMPRLKNWDFAGNSISSAALQAVSNAPVQRLDLRLNRLADPLRLTSFSLGALTCLDLRHSGRVGEIDLSNLASLQVLHVEHLDLDTLQVNGTNLRALYADHNRLDQIVVMPVPMHLNVYSVAYNRFETLPEWLTDLPHIVTISAHHNRLKYLPHRILMNARLKNLFVNDNALRKLPDSIENCGLEVLNLQNNAVEYLPSELLKSAHRLRHLNATNNRLSSLPPANSLADLNKLYSLRVAANALSESAVSVVAACRRLRVLDLAHNQLRFFNDSALARLTFLEEVNLSCNLLTSLPADLAQLPALQILRAHSNRIETIPSLAASSSLKLIDLSNNCLERVNVDYCISPSLQCLDVTCNPFCEEQERPLALLGDSRALSVVDVSRRNLLSDVEYGYSETSGHRSKLCIRQIRPKDRGNVVFGIIDAGSSFEIAEVVHSKLCYFLELLAAERSVDALHKAILRTHEHLGAQGERLGASVLVFRLLERRLLLAHSGHVGALLVRRDRKTVRLAREKLLHEEAEYERLRRANAILTQDGRINGVSTSGSAVGFSFLYPAVLPSPSRVALELDGSEECVVIASQALWLFLDDETVAETVRSSVNAHQAAKRLQDLAQAYEHLGNLSVLVVKFSSQSRMPDFAYNSPGNRDQEELYALPTVIQSPQSSNEDHALRNIEERLDQISLAINKIEDEANASRFRNSLVLNASSFASTVSQAESLVRGGHLLQQQRLRARHAAEFGAAARSSDFAASHSRLRGGLLGRADGRNQRGSDEPGPFPEGEVSSGVQARPSTAAGADAPLPEESPTDLLDEVMLRRMNP
uniref:PPM-type phosphatase domain-containing protein n=1 Tax=Steinernema glaseri TaxID=37863 RepID=A0A1I7ZCU3_9BILA